MTMREILKPRPGWRKASSELKVDGLQELQYFESPSSGKSRNNNGTTAQNIAVRLKTENQILLKPHALFPASKGRRSCASMSNDPGDSCAALPNSRHSAGCDCRTCGCHGHCHWFGKRCPGRQVRAWQRRAKSCSHFRSAS